MTIKIFDKNSIKEWNNYHKKMPNHLQSIFLNSKYYTLFEECGYGESICYYFENDDQIAMYPFLKRSINSLNLINYSKDYYDIEGALGYNGIFSSSYKSNFTEKFSNNFDNYCKKNNVIAEFTRCNPIILNHRIKKRKPEIINKNIIIDLNRSKEDLWKNSYEYSVRKNINKAKKNNLKTEQYFGSMLPNKLLDEFKNIYFNTMQRNNANKESYFNDIFFEKLLQKLKNNCLFSFTSFKSKYISCELILIDKMYAYSFIGGTLSDFFEFRPNEILKHNLILFLKKNRFKKYCIGGGHKLDDGIYKYKKNFSKDCDSYDFYIIKQIHNNKIYKQLCNLWKSKYNDKDNNYFFKYRK